MLRNLKVGFFFPWFISEASLRKAMNQQWLISFSQKYLYHPPQIIILKDAEYSTHKVVSLYLKIKTD